MDPQPDPAMGRESSDPDQEEGVEQEEDAPERLDASEKPKQEAPEKLEPGPKTPDLVSASPVVPEAIEKVPAVAPPVTASELLLATISTRIERLDRNNSSMFYGVLFLAVSLFLVSLLNTDSSNCLVCQARRGAASLDQTKMEVLKSNFRDTWCDLTTKTGYGLAKGIGNDWFQAQLHAKELGGMLPHVLDLATQAEMLARVRQFHPEGTPVWLGANRLNPDEVWQWYPSGKFLRFQHWAPGEPNNRTVHMVSSRDLTCGDSRGENCLVFDNNGLWDDRHCYTRLRYIVQFPFCFA
jgi:hypothetical protein